MQLPMASRGLVVHEAARHAPAGGWRQLPTAAPPANKEEEEQQKQQIEQIDQKPSALAGLLGLFGRRRGLGAGGDDSATGGSSGELGSWADEQYCFVEDGVEYCLPQLYGACCVRAGSTALAAYL